MTKIVLDTNALVAGIFWKGPPHQILKLVFERKLLLAVSGEILIEYQRILERIARSKLGIDITAAWNLLQLAFEVHTPLCGCCIRCASIVLHSN